MKRKFYLYFVHNRLSEGEDWSFLFSMILNPIPICIVYILANLSILNVLGGAWSAGLYCLWIGSVIKVKIFN